MKYIRISKSKKTIQINSTVLIIFCLLFPHFEPSCFDDMGGIIDSLYNIGRIISACIIFILYLTLYLKKRKINCLFISYSILWLYYLVNSIIKNGLQIGEIIRVVSYLIIAMMVEYCIKKQAKELIHAFVCLYEFLVVINFITILLFPNGMYMTDWQWENYFLGFRNLFTLYFIPCMTFEIIWAKIIGKWKRSIIILMVCLFSAVFSASATCLLITVAYIILFITKFYHHKIFNIASGIIFYLIAFFAVVIFRLQSLLEPLFNALGRNVTMTGRTLIWDYTIQKIIQNPLTGYGKQSAEYRIAQIHKVYGASHAHNFFLEHLYCGGLIQFVLVIIWLGFICINLWKARNLEYTHIIMIGIIALLFMMLVEIGWTISVYGFFMFVGYFSLNCNINAYYNKRRKNNIIYR